MKVRIIKPEQKVLQDLYETQHLTTTQIAALYGVSKRQVHRWMHSYPIEMRPAGRGLVAQGKRQPTREELMKWVQEDILSYQEIADKFGTTHQAVLYWLKKFDIPYRTEEMAKTVRWYRNKEQPQMPTKEEFLKLYEQGLSVERIASDLHVPVATLRYFCKKQGVEFRLNGWKGGNRFTCRDGHVVRSIYEQRIDDWLFEHGISHVIEPLLPFDRRYRSDFLANGYYIEIWGVRKNAEYNQRKLRKLQQYKEHDLPLIEIEEHHFDSRRDALWQKRLQKLL